MEIVSGQLAADLAAGRKVKLNLGAGRERVAGFYGVDQVRLEGTDVVADLNEGLGGFPEGSVAEIVTRHTLEHIREFLPLMEEVHRVLVPGGRMKVIVPHFSNPMGYSDPTHVRFFGLYTFYYFARTEDQGRRKVPDFYTTGKFRVEGMRLRFDRETLTGKVRSAVVEAVVNSCGWMQAGYEKWWVWAMPAAEVACELVAVK